MTPGDRSLATAPWLHLPASAKILDVLGRNGRPIRFVGGTVRDALLGRAEGVDLDLATPLPPEEVMARLEAAGIRAVPTGIAHGTVTALLDGAKFEVTTLRRDLQTDGRHAKVAFTDDFEEDAARRDLTINAMSCDRDGRLYDYFGGVDDLQAGRVRFVGAAARRVQEDYLRILRYFRFYAGYGRPPADQEALEACRLFAKNIRLLAPERVCKEMIALLAAKNPVAALELMDDAGVLPLVLPGQVALAHLQRLLDLEIEPDPILRLAALVRTDQDLPARIRQAGDISVAWRLSKVEARRLSDLLTHHMPDPGAFDHEARRDLYRLGPSLYCDLASLSVAAGGHDKETLSQAIVRASSFKRPVFPLKGSDIVAAGVAQGSKVGDFLKMLEHWWIERDMRPDRAACLARLDELLSKGAS